MASPLARPENYECAQLSFVRVFSHVVWGAGRTIHLRLYSIHIQSKLDYGSPLYASATGPRVRILDAVHHAGIRLATNAFHLCPIPSLLVDAGAFPLTLHHQSLVAWLWYRCQGLPGRPTFITVHDTSLDPVFTRHLKSPQPYGLGPQGFWAAGAALSPTPNYYCNTALIHGTLRAFASILLPVYANQSG